MTKPAMLALAVALATAPVPGQQPLQKIADSLEVTSPAPGAKTLQLPKAQDAKVEFLCADYEQIVDKKGNIKADALLSEVPVNVAFKVTGADGKSVISKDYELKLQPADAAQQGNAKPVVVPALLEWRGGEGNFTFGNSIVAPKELAEVFSSEFGAVVGHPVSVKNKAGKGSILFSVDKALEAECYTLDIRPEGIVVKGGDRAGLVWGARSLMQILRQTGGSVPCGRAADMPRFKVRGFMLDVARTPITLEAIKDIIRMMSWFKMNDLHLHLSDNYIFHEQYVDEGKDPFKESYAAFRLESNVVGANGHKLTAQDVFYTKEEFMELVKFAKLRGVNIVPEFDVPGHALAFTRVRPDLIYQGPMAHFEKRRCEMLDASSDETLRFVNSVFDEFLNKDAKLGKAVFGDCKVVHVGADEFFGAAEDYRRFADGLLNHVLSKHHTPRIWGSLNTKKGKTPVQAKGVQMNLWNGGWAKAWDSVEQGYDVINTNDGHLYIVPFAPYYRMDKNHKWVYNHWLPNRIGNETLPAGHPQLIGATFAVWNDMTDRKHTGYGAYDLWKTISESSDIVSQKMWGATSVPRDFEAHRALIEKLGFAPQCNPLYLPKEYKPIEAKVISVPYRLNRPALGPNYELTMEVELKDNKTPGQELLSGSSGRLLAVNSRGHVGFVRDDTMEFDFGVALPVGKKVKLQLIGTPGATRLFIDGQEAKDLTLVSFHDNKKDLCSTFILPLNTIGMNLRGTVSSFRVVPSKPGENAAAGIIKEGQATQL